MTAPSPHTHLPLVCESVEFVLQEKRRIEKAGGMVSPMRNREGAFVGPQRVFGPDGFAPGLAMSRSVGDLLAHSLGVSCVPSCSQRRLTSNDQFVVRHSSKFCFSHHNVRVQQPHSRAPCLLRKRTHQRGLPQQVS